jgi:glucosylceramidase
MSSFSPTFISLLSMSLLAAPHLSATATVYQTSRGGDRLEVVAPQETSAGAEVALLQLDFEQRRQRISGFGGAMTESSAYLLSQLSEEKRQAVIDAYFGPNGAAYSLLRLPIASCDFSLESYTYAADAEAGLADFSIERDRRWLLPRLHEALAASQDGVQIMASPWTAPPWMKDNAAYFGGSLLPEHYDTFAQYLVRYLDAYAAEGIPIWSITPLNEPLGNGAKWESMHFTPESMATFLTEHLGPTLEASAHDPKVFIFDQNRSEVGEWAEILHDPEVAAVADGIAVHWYSSTVDVYPEVLDHLAEEFPNYPVIHSEGCIDVLGDDEPAGVWLEDDWYWREEATDWGYHWAPEEQKEDHPAYRPFYRYVQDMLVGLQHGMIGWIDWNIVLDFHGGPNHARNFCGAPVLVDPANDTVYYTPLYYAMAHFSRFVRPGAEVIGLEGVPAPALGVAAQNPDGTTAVILFNPGESELAYRLPDGAIYRLAPQALQSITLKP